MKRLLSAAGILLISFYLTGCCDPEIAGNVPNTLRAQQTNNWCWAATTQMLAQHVGIDPVLRVWITRAWPLVNRRQAHLRHQQPNPAAANLVAIAAQMPCHLAAAVPRARHERLVDHRHQRQRLGCLRHRGVVIGRAADLEQATLR